MDGLSCRIASCQRSSTYLEPVTMFRSTCSVTSLQRHFARTSPARCYSATYDISQDGPTRLTVGKDTDTPGLQASEHTMQKAVRDVTTGSVRFSAAISGWPPNESLGH